MNAVTELATLWATRPGLDATPEQCAAWYRAKAELHEQLADQAPTARETAREQEHAVDALAHATRLLIEAEATRAVTTPVGVMA